MDRKYIVDSVKTQNPIAEITMVSPRGITYEFSIYNKGIRVGYEIVVPLQEVNNGGYMNQEEAL